ncbi:hypothetical protein ISN76_19005 [Dyella halodurans]|uniref:Uncharacterized protein n=1 Tax=Dyella halodurans TaxID=1920171 RepID=A0ABV9C0U6_9GAMM|nr:hypothetical protein [Dyella halodurans]
MKPILSNLAVIFFVWTNVALAGQVSKTESCSNPYEAFGLHGFNEPTLTATGKAPGYFAVRLTYLPTFRHPIALRYERNGAKTTRRAIVLSGQFGQRVGPVAFEKTDSPSVAEIDDIKKAIGDAGYWNLPVTDNVRGADGDILIVEVVSNGECKGISRWEPESRADARGLAKLVDVYVGLFERAGIWQDVSP